MYIYINFAGVVQWLVHGLAKAGMPVRFWSLAPFSLKHTKNCVLIYERFKIVGPIIKLSS